MVRKGPDNPRWAGDNIGNNGMHKRVRRARGDANEYDCVDCGNEAEDWSQVHDSDRLDIQSYEPRCTPCHMIYDNKGRKHSDEMKDRISAAKTGVPNPHKGHKPSAATRARMSTAQYARWERYRNGS